MKKAILEQINKIKSHFDKDKDNQKKKKNYNIDGLINDLQYSSKYFLSADNIKNLELYNISNLREYCNISKTKDKCNENLHCGWTDNTCKLRLNISG